MPDRDPRIEPEDPHQEGSASTVTDWFGQQAEEDAQLAERLAEGGSDADAERAFEERSHHGAAAAGQEEHRSAAD